MIRRALLLPLLFLPTAAYAQPTPWQAEKCRLYESYWTEALDRFGSDDINYAFIAANENFIASGCTEPATACPVSTQEQDIANALTIVMMNAGAASTFLPYRCAVERGSLRGSAPLD